MYLVLEPVNTGLGINRKIPETRFILYLWIWNCMTVYCFCYKKALPLYLVLEPVNAGIGINRQIPYRFLFGVVVYQNKPRKNHQ